LNRSLHMLDTLPQLYMHVDIDVLDPAEAPGVDFPAARGLQLAELKDLVQQAAGMGNLAALALTAVNPEKDIDGRTVRAALDVIEAAIGRVKS
jgi:arginase